MNILRSRIDRGLPRRRQRRRRRRRRRRRPRGGWPRRRPAECASGKFSPSLSLSHSICMMSLRQAVRNGRKWKLYTLLRRPANVIRCSDLMWSRLGLHVMGASSCSKMLRGLSVPNDAYRILAFIILYYVISNYIRLNYLKLNYIKLFYIILNLLYYMAVSSRRRPRRSRSRSCLRMYKTSIYIHTCIYIYIYMYLSLYMYIYI